ncbi:TonB-dependent receptor [Helicobacter sp. 12S02634-8]|uniref:TonB-dependent receptor domain-containing protein n=1 Tax=Helicobacter sp. 12S02634-8 TaxID=1476199 RepID=UPI00155380C6|nr:TonB-dependent receptor [Helicobacter sp. 12S02634-8]
MPLLLSAQDGQPNTYTLEKSVVSASGFEQNLQDAPASISVVTGKWLRSKNFFDLAGALNGVPGVDIGTEMGKNGGLNVSIRGMPSDYTLIMMDGHRQDAGGNIATDNVGWSQTFSSFMPPVTSIEKIEVIRGPMSTLYGSDAIGGMVNIILKKPNMQRFEGAAQLSTIQNQHMKKFGAQYSQDLYLSLPLIQNKLAFSLRTREYFRTPWDTAVPYEKNGVTLIRTPATPVYIGLPTKANIYDIGGRLAYRIDDKNYTYIDAQYFYDDYDNSQGQLGGPTSAKKDYINTRANFILAHQGRYDFGQWDTSIQYNDTANKGRVIGQRGSSDPIDYGNRELEGRDIIVDTKLVTPLGKGWYSNNLSVGGRYWFQWMRDMLVKTPTFSQNTGALFVEDEWDPLSSVSVTLGLRYDYNQTYHSNLSPRIYVAYTPVEIFTLKGGISTGYKAPYINELVPGINGYGNQGKFPYIGNPDLKPEHSLNYELSAILNLPNIGTASVTYFFNDFKDKIAKAVVHHADTPRCVPFSSTGTDAYCNMFVNQDSAYVQGIEVYLATQSFYGFSLQGSYTFLHSRYNKGEFKGFPLVDTPAHQVYGKLDYAYKDFDIYLMGNYKSQRAILPTSAVINGAKGSEIEKAIGHYKAYVVFDLVISQQISKHLRGSFGIYNLLDQNFQDYTFVKCAKKHDVIVNRYNVAQEGRRFWISLNMDF